MSARHNHYFVQIVNTDPTIILATQDALDLLDIGYNTSDAWVRDGHSEAWRIDIGRRDEIIKLAQVVHLQSAKKQEALQIILDAPRKSWNADDPRVNEIRSLYWIDGFSIQEIADYFETSRGRIAKMMDRYEIPKRERLEAVRLGRKKVLQ